MLTNDSKIKGSFTGKYLQVLPDDRDDYNDIYGQGSFTMTGLDFAFTVEKSGAHTLFLRWAGGDMGGGSDSLYAVVRRDDTDAIVPGPDIFKPKRIGIADNPGQYLGCCYHHATHECPCYTPGMRPESCEEEGGYWVSTRAQGTCSPACENGLPLPPRRRKPRGPRVGARPASLRKVRWRRSGSLSGTSSPGRTPTTSQAPRRNRR